ncbi:hypothetical protein I3760_16G013200 [Carya illinoinensis]|nr:hypothetical protein I3760_16G013200 [Carya illinoinensis]
MDGGLATCSVVLPEYQYSHVGSFGLCLYISHARLGNRLDQCNCITARFTLNSPSIMIRGCGVRIFYEQDLTELVQILSQKNLGLVPPLYVQAAVFLILLIKKNVQAAGPHDKIYATGPLDFHPSTRYSFCFPPSEVQNWFTHQSCGQSVAVDLPPKLYGDDNWMGLVLFASFSIRRDPETLLDNCQFRMRTLDNLDDKISSCHTSRHEIKQFITQGGFCSIAYIPGKELLPMLLLQQERRDNRVSPQYYCSNIAASFASDCPIITMERCGLHLLYKHDQVQFEQKLKHYMNGLFYEYRDSTGPLMADLEKTNVTTVTDNKVGQPRGTVQYSNKDLEIEISIRPILRQEKTNGTRE